MNDLECDTLPCYECTLHESEYSQYDGPSHMDSVKLVWRIEN